MIGNASEWCSDWYAPYPPGPASDPTGPATGEWRVRRGGSWNMGPSKCRSCARAQAPPHAKSHAIGFRAVLELPPAAK